MPFAAFTELTKLLTTLEMTLKLNFTQLADLASAFTDLKFIDFNACWFLLESIVKSNTFQVENIRPTLGIEPRTFRFYAQILYQLSSP